MKVIVFAGACLCLLFGCGVSRSNYQINANPQDEAPQYFIGADNGVDISAVMQQTASEIEELENLLKLKTSQKERQNSGVIDITGEMMGHMQRLATLEKKTGLPEYTSTAFKGGYLDMYGLLRENSFRARRAYVQIALGEILSQLPGLEQLEDIDSPPVAEGPVIFLQLAQRLGSLEEAYEISTPPSKSSRGKSTDLYILSREYYGRFSKIIKLQRDREFEELFE